MQVKLFYINAKKNVYNIFVILFAASFSIRIFIMCFASFLNYWNVIMHPLFIWFYDELLFTGSFLQIYIYSTCFHLVFCCFRFFVENSREFQITHDAICYIYLYFDIPWITVVHLNVCPFENILFWMFDCNKSVVLNCFYTSVSCTIKHRKLSFGSKTIWRMFIDSLKLRLHLCKPVE